MSSFSYIALITPKEKITFTMSVCEGTVIIGLVLGTLVNGPLIESTSLADMAYINAGFTVLPLIIVWIFVTDVTHTGRRKYTWREVVGASHALESIKCMFKQRPGHSRLLLQLSFVTYSCSFVTISGFLGNSFLYFVKEEGMSLTVFSVYSALGLAGRGACGSGMIWLANRFGVTDRSNLLVGSLVSIFVGFTIMSIDGIAYNAWIGAIFLCTQTVVFAEIRSLQTEICKLDELGKLFSYDALIQLILSAVAAASFKWMYSATLNIWPGFFLMVCAFLHLLALVLVVIMDRVKRVDEVYTPRDSLEEESD